MNKLERWKFLTPLTLAVLFVAAMVGGAWADINWNTTTVDLDVKSDVSAIGSATGRNLNINILGLDELGNVDIYGETGGSTIIASVSTLLGTMTDGGGTPIGAAGGTFASVTRYILLNQGIGMAHIVYPNDASGTDLVNIVLFERRIDDGGNAVTRQIGAANLSIEVDQAAAQTGILNIEQFTKAASDTDGVSDAVPVGPINEGADVGIAAGAAKMSANVAGGIFEVKAYIINPDRSYTHDATAQGTVTLTLTGAPKAGVETNGSNRASATTTYTATGTMMNGVANISIPTGFTEAGRYTVVATMDDLSSITHKISDDAATTDYVSILPEATPAKVSISCDRDVVSITGAANLANDADDDGINFDPTFTASMLDQFGNKIKAKGYAGATVKVTDANSKIGDFNLVIAGNANSVSAEQDSNGYGKGLATLSGSVPANSLIATSDAVSLKTVDADNQLVMAYTVTDNGDNDINDATQLVGQSFQFVDTAIGVDDATPDGVAMGTEQSVLVATDNLRITNLTTKESISVAVLNHDPDVFNALFTKPTSNAKVEANGFLIQHVGQSYADIVVYPYTGSALDFTAQSPSKAYIKDPSGNIVTEVPAKVNANGTFTVTINGARIGLYDAYGNLNNAGADVTVTTLKGTASAAINVGADAPITINYPVGTTGTELLKFNFTQPGIASVNDGSGLTVTFSTVDALASFDTYPDGNITLSVNAASPLTIFPRDASGTLKTEADGYFIDYDTTGLLVYYDVNTDGDVDAADITTVGGAFVPGANVGANTGRFPIMVQAKTTPGSYDLTVRSIDSTITKTVTFDVVKYTVPLAVSQSSATVDAGESVDLTITGGSAPYTAESADISSATASVAGAILTITGVTEDTSTTVTVTDAASDTVQVEVTVGAGGAAQEPPTQTHVGLCDAACQASAPVTATGVDFSYTEGVTILVGAMDATFTQVWWLNSSCEYTTDYAEAASGETALSCSVDAPDDAAWLFWFVTAEDLATLDWENGAYELLFYELN